MRKIKETKMIRSHTKSNRLKTIREDWKYKGKRRRQTKREQKTTGLVNLNKLEHLRNRKEFQQLNDIDTQL
jgi:hypothetical protein